MAQDETPQAGHPQTQLNGWKEISAYFGRSPRTVQRWERDFGLPIRRFGMGRAEVVHAYVEDLERWRLTAEAQAIRGTAPVALAEAAGPAHTVVEPGFLRRLPYRYLIPLATVLLLLVAAALFWTSMGGTATGTRDSSREPVFWNAVADTFVAKGANGDVLWTYQFPFTISNRPNPDNATMRTDTVRIDDVDGDGHKEVLLFTMPADADKRNYRFYAFSHDGRLRWTFAHRSPQTFGDETYAPPFLANMILLTPRARPGKDLWLVSVHSPWFPSVVSRVEADGSSSGEYWSNGFITYVWAGDLAGKPAVLIGARNNESEGASLALLDPASPYGSAPAAAARFTCRTCPAGAPRRFVQLPRPARLRALHGTSYVLQVHVDDNSRVVAWVAPGHDVPGFWGVTIYTFDRDLRPLSVGLNDGWDQAVNTVVSRNLIPPPPPTPALEEVRHVRWWDGTRLVDLVAPAPALDGAGRR